MRSIKPAATSKNISAEKLYRYIQKGNMTEVELRELEINAVRLRALSETKKRAGRIYKELDYMVKEIRRCQEMLDACL